VDQHRAEHVRRVDERLRSAAGHRGDRQHRHGPGVDIMKQFRPYLIYG
jgi:hypothetical protein